MRCLRRNYANEIYKTKYFVFVVVVVGCRCGMKAM